MYKLHISNRARRDLKLMSLANKEVFIFALQDIKDEPLLGKPLTRNLSGRFSYRIGVNRIIYTVNEKDKVIEILSAGHRSVVYD